MIEQSTSRYLDTATAARILNLSPRTLEKFRITGCGPDFFKLGRRAYYTLDTLQAWAESRRRQSTSAA